MSSTATRLAALLVTDIVGSTELKSRYGTAANVAALARHNTIFESIAAKFPGFHILKHTGDGYFAAVDTVADAVRFALLFQHAMRAEHWAEVPLTARLGINVGEVAFAQTLGREDVIGLGADLAASVMSLALGGQILMTRFPFDEARQHVREHPPPLDGTAPPLRWLAHGPYCFKGADEPLEVFEVGAEALAPLSPPADNAKARRGIRAGEEETLGWRPAIGLEVPSRPGWILERPLGTGGFGEAWLAIQARYRQQRVFKFCFDEERLRALKREVILVRLLRDALGDRNDIIRLHEIKLDAPPFFLESEYAEEGNLAEWAERQGGLEKVPLTTRLEIVARVASAVAAAHGIGILHKDLKPTNILIVAGDAGPAPRVVDFGIGTVMDQSVLAERGITATGFTFHSLQSTTGTPIYSPPEFLAGRPFTIQGDIYALGVLLYQMAVGDFTRPLGSGWERDVSDELLRSDIAKCVDVDPARRFRTAGELAQQLHALQERHGEIRRLAEADALGARLVIKRERIWRILMLLFLPAIVAALSQAISDDSSLLLFVADLATMWFACVTVFLDPEPNDAKTATRRSGLVELLANGVRLFLFTAAQTLVFYGVLRIGQLDGSIPWQLAGLMGLAWSTVGLAVAGRAIARSPAGRGAFLSLLLVPQVFTSGYIIPAYEMPPIAVRICRFTPAFAARTVMDTSFLWMRKLSRDGLGDHWSALRDLQALGPDRKLLVGEMYGHPKPAISALLVLIAWGFVGGGIAACWRLRMNKQ